jgi:hypothetical protein
MLTRAARERFYACAERSWRSWYISDVSWGSPTAAQDCITSTIAPSFCFRLHQTYVIALAKARHVQQTCGKLLKRSRFTVPHCQCEMVQVDRQVCMSLIGDGCTPSFAKGMLAVRSISTEGFCKSVPECRLRTPLTRRSEEERPRHIVTIEVQLKGLLRVDHRSFQPRLDLRYATLWHERQIYVCHENGAK